MSETYTQAFNPDIFPAGVTVMYWKRAGGRHEISFKYLLKKIICLWRKPQV